MNKFLLSIALLFGMSTSFVFAAATDDNEVMIAQTGDTLKLYIDQIGFGNKIGQNNYSSGSGTAMTMTGHTLDLNIDMIGNQNLLFGPFITDSTDITLLLSGNSNSVDWNIGASGSADDSDINFNVDGDSNTFDLDQGYSLSAERLNADLVLVGNSNVFDVDWESDDATWNFTVTGGSNNINTLQKDGEQTLNLTLTGSSADIDINQLSGTCVSGAGNSCSSPDAHITLTADSENAIIQINQKDAANDS